VRPVLSRSLTAARPPRSLVGSCGSCKQCGKGRESYCKGLVWSYNSKLPDGRLTFGGYSNNSTLCSQAVGPYVKASH
jgi:D-arabinose 1-dehydrogenase-like Zn-dependent alcohol dehydrogenase